MMKKTNFKSLKLNKKSISNLSSNKLTGKGPDTIGCDPNSRDCGVTIRHTTRVCIEQSIWICGHITRVDC